MSAGYAGIRGHPWERCVSETIVVQVASIIILGVAAQWLAWRLRLPSILLLLLLGFVAGPFTGFLDPEKRCSATCCCRSSRCAWR